MERRIAGRIGGVEAMSLEVELAGRRTTTQEAREKRHVYFEVKNSLILDVKRFR